MSDNQDVSQWCFDCIDGNHNKCLHEWGIGHICKCPKCEVKDEAK